MDLEAEVWGPVQDPQQNMGKRALRTSDSETCTARLGESDTKSGEGIDESCLGGWPKGGVSQIVHSASLESEQTFLKSPSSILEETRC